MELDTDGRPETARQRTRRLKLWRRLLQDISLDEVSFDGRFGLGSRRATLASLVPWCLGYLAPSRRRQAGPDALFGFVGLFLLTLLGLAESEAQRSLPQSSAPPAAVVRR